MTFLPILVSVPPRRTVRSMFYRIAKKEKRSGKWWGGMSNFLVACPIASHLDDSIRLAKREFVGVSTYIP